jgi:hypothetical protein
LVDDFFYSKITAKLLSILTSNNNYGLQKDSYRNIARRYAKIVSDEFGYCFKDVGITPIKFEKTMHRFIDASLIAFSRLSLSWPKRRRKNDRF